MIYLGEVWLWDCRAVVEFSKGHAFSPNVTLQDL